VWSFLSTLHQLDINRARGEEIIPEDNKSPLGKLVGEYISGSHFSCIVTPSGADEDWMVLARNKFGDSVGLAYSHEAAGDVIILPQLIDKAGFLSKLLKNVLPAMSPHLFPFLEEGQWTHRPEYELPKVIELKAKQVEIQKKQRRKSL